MHILLTGGTGLIGRHLCRFWLDKGYRLTVWSRRPAQVAQVCGAGVRGIARLDELGEEPVDAVVNLGRLRRLPIAPGRRTDARCYGLAASPSPSS